MGGGRRASLALCVAALGAADGCMLTSPLDDYPAAPSTSAGGSASGGARASAGGDAPAESGGHGVASGECDTNQDCAGPGAGEPYRCRPSDHSCVALKSDECPLAYGDASDPNAIFFGAFATLTLSAPEDNAVVWAHRLALDQLSGDNVGGLPGGPAGARRPLVMVVCNNDDKVVATGLTHLADDLEVPAVLATLKPGDLRRGFEKHNARNIFYLSPVTVTSTVTTEDDNGLIWGLLGQSSDLAPAYTGLLTLSEKFVRATRHIPGSEPLRVALITTDNAFDSDLADAVGPALSFNGQSTDENHDAGNYAGFTVDLAAPELEALAAQIANFRPHIIISAASEVLTQPNGLLEQIEAVWANPVNPGSSMARPMYLLSPYNAGDLSNVSSLISNFLELDSSMANANQRFVGISIAGAEDTTLQNQYATRLRTRFKKANVDSANYYDAVYFLADAMFAAGGTTTPTGPSVAQGMQRLLSGDAFAVGPDSIDAVFKALGKPGATIELQSTLGPPSFDPDSGVRPVDGGVFCFQREGTSSLTLQTDALRYDRDLAAYRGNFPCFDGFFP